LGSFCRIFLGKKEGGHTSGSDMKLFEHNFGKKNWIFEFLSEKYPISKKKLVEMESGK
jgi:hypothetical protein